jgi:hypothetical protein
MPCAPAGPCDGVCSGAFGIVADQLSATFCNPHRERHEFCNLSTTDLASDHRSSAQEPGPPRHSHAGASAPPRGLGATVATGGMITVNHATSEWTEGTVNGMLEPFVSAGTNATFVVCPSTSPPCATISISACHRRSHQG